MIDLTPYWPLVLLGGAIGAVLRFEIGRQIGRRWPHPFPLGTFVINVAGSFFLGLLFASTFSHDMPFLGTPLWLWAFLGIGVLGSFTTFSTFGVEVVTLLQNRKPLIALLYVTASALLGLAGAWAGYELYVNR